MKKIKFDRDHENTHYQELIITVIDKNKVIFGYRNSIYRMVYKVNDNNVLSIIEKMLESNKESMKDIEKCFFTLIVNYSLRSSFEQTEREIFLESLELNNIKRNELIEYVLNNIEDIEISSYSTKMKIK